MRNRRKGAPRDPDDLKRRFGSHRASDMHRVGPETPEEILDKTFGSWATKLTWPVLILAALWFVWSFVR